MNRNHICSDETTSTAWGCTLKGKAMILKNDEGDWTERKAKATVTDAFGVEFKFAVQHKFDDKEKDFTINGVPKLTLTANGVGIGTFTVNKNKNKQTHDSNGYVTNNYEHNQFVTVSCNDSCACTANKSTPVCPLRAEIRMPKINPDPKTEAVGYHREA